MRIHVVAMLFMSGGGPLIREIQKIGHNQLWKEGTPEQGMPIFEEKQGEETIKGKEEARESSVKIEEINALSGDNEEGDILLKSRLELSYLVTTNDIAVQDWIMDSRASFHVTPHHY